VSNVVHGRDPFAGFDNLGRTFLVTEIMSVAQFGIGEMGNGNARWEGSLPHLLLHGGLGCAAMEVMGGRCASGFFAGASQSVLAGSNLTDEQKLELAPLVGALSGFVFSGGNAINVSLGSTIAQSGIVNNYLTHADIEAAEALLENCTASEEECERQVVQFLTERSALNDEQLLRDCNYNAQCIADFSFDASNDLITGAELLTYESSFDADLRNRIIISGAADYGNTITQVLGFDEEDWAYISSQPRELQVISVAERLSIYTPEEIVALSLASLGASSLATLTPRIAANLVTLCRSSPTCINLYLSAEVSTGVIDLVACAEGDPLSCTAALTPGTTFGGRLIDNGYRPITGVGAGIRTPTGFTSYVGPNGDIIHFSPQGLLYGPDPNPNFVNRVDHVMDHTAPNPAKSNHTVFNITSEDDVLALVDEAWVARGPSVPNDPSAYVVPMGRVVGTNGETYVRIVVNVDTSGNISVVTAYPVGSP
jgi:hypothetical protein